MSKPYHTRDHATMNQHSRSRAVMRDLVEFGCIAAPGEMVVLVDPAGVARVVASLRDAPVQVGIGRAAEVA